MLPGNGTKTGSLPELAGDGVRLRALRRTDAAAILEIFGDPSVVRTMDVDLLHDLEDARSFIDDVHVLARDDTLYQWGVVSDTAGLVVGTCTLANLDWHNRRAEIGFAVGARHQGKELASKAARLVLDHAFGSLALHRVEGWVATSNAASIKTLERLGFRHEGTLRERDLVDGVMVDSHAYSLLAAEWRRS